MNMKKIIICMAALTANAVLHAQNDIEQVLASIEKNNTSLKALHEEAKAQQLGNRTDIFLANPEMEFSYLWGSPAENGNRKNFSLTQTFDIATVTGMKSRMAEKQNGLIELQYKADRQNVLLQAKQYCIDLIYYNALRKELETRLSHARTVADAYKKKLDRGNANILEYNKARLNLSAIQGEISKTDVERQALLNSLKQLNGGMEVAFTSASYENTPLPPDFEDWYKSAEQKNPLLAYVRQQIEVSKHEVKLNKTMGLPSFSAGYTSEITPGQKYRGFTVGISIPLWENKNKVRQAKANVAAAEMKQQESKQYFYNQLQILYMRAAGLQQTAGSYRKSLAELNNTELLIKAFNAGEISLLDFMVEIGLYYDNVNQTLAAERDFEKAKAELYAVEL